VAVNDELGARSLQVAPMSSACLELPTVLHIELS
jgi:hypothetical protein